MWKKKTINRASSVLDGSALLGFQNKRLNFAFLICSIIWYILKIFVLSFLKQILWKNHEYGC